MRAGRLEAWLFIAPFCGSIPPGRYGRHRLPAPLPSLQENCGLPERIADALARTCANQSRLNLIEQAERLMIEELHEWLWCDAQPERVA